MRCRFFAWLALRNMCWTPDRLARRGLDHQERCPFYDQEEESMVHIMLQCIFTKEVWTSWILTSGSTLVEWCNDKNESNLCKKDIRALMILVMWELWKHRNRIVFEGATPSTKYVTKRIANEGRVWRATCLLKDGVDDFLVALTVGTNVSG